MEYRFLLVGKSGSGKSSTANNIMGEDAFPTHTGFDSGTKTCEVRRTTKHRIGSMIRIADTPGLFDPDPKKPVEAIKEEIVKAIANLHPGMHALLYVVKIGRYTPEEQETFNHLKEVFDFNVVKHVIIIFTGGDELKKKKMSLDDLLIQASEPLKQVLKECGNRVLVFNNTKRHSKKIKELMGMVDRIWRENGEAPYMCNIQTHVNVKLERTATMRTQEKIERDPGLRELFATMAENARKAKKDFEDQDQILEDTIYKKNEKEKALEEALAEKEKEKQKRKEREREETEKQERAGKEKKEQEEKQRHEEEERERKRQEQERKDAEENLRKELEDLKRKEEMEQKVKEEKKKMKMKHERKLAEERERREKEEMERVKDAIAQDKEKGWAQNVAEGAGEVVGGAWKLAKGWFGF